MFQPYHDDRVFIIISVITEIELLSRHTVVISEALASKQLVQSTALIMIKYVLTFHLQMHSADR